jgi:MOSC domain-containing protein YiiM
VIEEGFVKAGDAVSIEKYLGETISLVQMYRDYYDKNKSEEILRLHLNAPIAIRARRALEAQLENLLRQTI